MKRAVNAKLRNLNSLGSRESQKWPEIKSGWSALLGDNVQAGSEGRGAAEGPPLLFQ